MGADATTTPKNHQNAYPASVLERHSEPGRGRGEQCWVACQCFFVCIVVERDAEKKQIHAQSSTSIVQNVLVPGHGFQLGNLETN